MTTAQIKISCGIGDLITYLARLPEFRKTENVDHLHLWVAGGFKDTPMHLLAVARMCPQVNSVSLKPENVDKNFDWIPDDNPLKYPMQIPYYTASSENIELPSGKHCLIQPVTSLGSFEGFVESRYLPPEGWAAICDRVHAYGYKIIQVGAFEERDYLGKYANKVDTNWCGLMTVAETIRLAQKCHMCVATNSWVWEVSAYAQIPTLCLYYTNYDKWCRIHVPKFLPPMHGIPTLRIEPEKDISKILKHIDGLAHIGLSVDIASPDIV